MNIPTPTTPGLRFDDADGVRGIDGGQPVRITRSRDGASMLLHELTEQALQRLQGAVFEPGCPDFSRPFVTRFAGFLEHEGHTYIAEPLPTAVPLRMVWAEVLQCRPGAFLQVLAALRGQLRLIVDGLHAAGQFHGALCVANVVLTTAGIYGLLRAGVQTPRGCVCLRPVPQDGCYAASPQFSVRGGGTESAEAVVSELIAVALDAGTIHPTTPQAFGDAAEASAITRSSCQHNPTTSP